MSLTNRSLALLTGVLLVLAVCSPNPIIAWLAVLASIATALLPTLTRRWNAAMLAFLGAGIALFGLLLLTLAPSVPGYFSVFAGFTAIAAIVPDLAPVLVVLLLRLANQAPWPPAAESLGLAIALIALLVCATMVWGKSPRSSVTLLQQSHACIAALSVCLGQSDGRFAALVLLVLVILSRAAARVTDGPAASLAIAGLAGLPPLGVFPGLVLVVLVLTGHDAWLLLPAGCRLHPDLARQPAKAPANLPAQGSDPLGRLAAVGPCPLLRLLRAGRTGPLVARPDGRSRVTAANCIIRSAEAEICRPWLRHILSHDEWTALAARRRCRALESCSPIGPTRSRRMPCSWTRTLRPSCRFRHRSRPATTRPCRPSCPPPPGMSG